MTRVANIRKGVSIELEDGDFIDYNGITYLLRGHDNRVLYINGVFPQRFVDLAHSVVATLRIENWDKKRFVTQSGVAITTYTYKKHNYGLVK